MQHNKLTSTNMTIAAGIIVIVTITVTIVVLVNYN